MLSEYSSLESWAFRVRDSSEVVRYQLDSDGTPNVYNSSGTKIWGVSNTGAQEKVRQETVEALTWVSGTGWSLANGTGSFFTVSPTAVTSTETDDAFPVGIAGSGCTLVLFTPTAATHGQIYPVLKTDSGTTPTILYAGGLPINSTSGTTNADMDAVGDILYLMPMYNSAVSWFIVNRYIH